MKKYLFILFLLLNTNVYASGQQTLVTPDGKVLGTAANPLVVTGAGGGQDPSVIFNVKTEYGAAGDGIELVDGSITSADNTFTSATASFTSADVGKVITIQGAGGTNIDLTTTIASVTSATEVELTDAASATVDTVRFTYGTDDTTEIQAAINAIGLASSNSAGTIFFPAGIYIVNGGFTQVDNSQIGLPTVAFADPMVSITFQGAVISSLNGATSNGSIIYSTNTGATNGTYSIISGRNAGETGDITRVRFSVRQMRFRTVQDPKHSGLDLVDVDLVDMEDVIVDTSVTYDSPAIQTTATSYGIKLPGTLTGNVSGGLQSVKVKTFYNGIMFGEHSNANNIMVVQAVNGFVFDSCRYPVTIQYASLESVVNNLVFTTATSYVNISMMQFEHRNTGEWVTAYDILDASHYGRGSIGYYVYHLGGPTGLTTSGGKYLSYFTYSSANGIRNTFNTDVTDAYYIITRMTSATTGGAGIILRQDDGAGTDSGHRLGALTFSGAYNTTGAAISGASIRGYSEEAFSTSSTGGTGIAFWNAPIGSGTQAETMRITNAGHVGIGNTAPAGRLVVSPPSSEVVAGAATITANGCGTVKQISSSGNVTTNTTDTFTAPTAANTGCCMDVVNIDATDTITLDQNANFVSAGGADVALGPGDSVRVCSNGTDWIQIGATGNN